MVAKNMLRRALDRMYAIGGALGALSLIAILVIIVMQMVARWIGTTFPGATNYAGYCMAAASFFSFAYALNNGAHIRVTLFLTKMGKYRVIGELWCFGIASVLSVWFAFYAIKAIRISYKFNDISQGQDALPLWIPQIVMGIGTVMLAIAFIDNFFRIILHGTHGIKAELLEDGGEA
ncbi:MAG: ABC transporter substrate-binding protein [Hyphomicrobiales bacterium]|nr:MAG: ABC transporter substrate-binding protein [Hyphomicrobiales bacterium]